MKTAVAKFIKRYWKVTGKADEQELIELKKKQIIDAYKARAESIRNMSISNMVSPEDYYNENFKP